jgi:lipopolysaccharide biosynthesis glycosyltransferase
LKKAVFTSFDELYSSYALVMLKTFCENYHGDHVDFYCLVPENLHAMENVFIDACKEHTNVSIKFVTLDGQKEIDKNFTDSDIAISYITKQCFHRIFIADSFPELDIAIYVDPDTMVVKDIQELIDYNLASPIAAVPEGMDSYKATVIGRDRVYFNNGVYKSSLHFWRDKSIASKMIDHVSENGLGRYPEQDLMNMFLSEHTSELPLKFNYFSWFDGHEFFRGRESDPVVIHFSGPDKPWKNHDGLEQRWTKIWRDKYSEIYGVRVESMPGFLDNYEFDKNWDGFK